MIATAFDEDNGTIGPPVGIPEEEIHSLSVFRGYHQETKRPVIVTAWKPDKEELEELNNGGRVYLICLGWTMSPVILSGLNPFKEGWVDSKQPKV